LSNKGSTITIDEFGDIEISVQIGYSHYPIDCEHYLYDSLKDRYYTFVPGALSAEDGAMVRKRISKYLFMEIKKRVENGEI
jgi:hypothetical protein